MAVPAAARFEISAPRTAAFRADQFDLFPGPIGKLLNAPGLPESQVSGGRSGGCGGNCRCLSVIP